MSWIPEEPNVPAEQRGSGRVSARFEDISQDGRLLLEALPTALAPVWRTLVTTHARVLVLEQGLVPILSRTIAEGGDGPISVNGPLEARGLYQFSHTANNHGEVDRIIVGMWARVGGAIGRTYAPQPAEAGQPIIAGRVFAEHVLTRPFAPPAQRKVTRIELGNGPVVPPDRYHWRAPEVTLALPAGVTSLDPELLPDSAVTVFGRDHTDSNQHVNSLVYTRLFVEAALRRLWDHGHRGPYLARRSEIAYRKPCFAGERARVLVQTFTQDDQVGAVCAMVPDDGDDAVKPRCFARLLLSK